MNVDYTFYRDVFEGVQIPQPEFSRAAKRAAEILLADTAGRSAQVLAQNAEHAAEVRLALCALAEICWQTQQTAESGGAVIKESVGTWSREYALPGAGPRAAMVAAEARYLGATGLLYRGRCGCV